MLYSNLFLFQSPNPINHTYCTLNLKLNENQSFLALTCQHIYVGTIRNGKNMRRDFASSLASVDLSTAIRVNGVSLVGINGNAE